MEILKNRLTIRWKWSETFNKKVLPIIRRVGEQSLKNAMFGAVAVMLLAGPYFTTGLFFGRSYDYPVYIVMAAGDFLDLCFLFWLREWFGGKPDKLLKMINGFLEAIKKI